MTQGIAGARRVDWPDTAHLPSMERPADFLVLSTRLVDVLSADRHHTRNKEPRWGER